MKKVLIGLLTLSCLSLFAEGPKEENVRYSCIYEVSSSKLEAQTFTGRLSLQETQLSTQPKSASSGVINTYAKGFRLYLIRNPKDLNLVNLVLQTEKNYYNSVTITPGGQIIRKPVVYSASYSHIKEQRGVTAVLEVKKKRLRKRFNGTLSCTFE